MNDCQNAAGLQYSAFSVDIPYINHPLRI